MSFHFIPVAASFPQVGDLRSVSEILDDLTDVIGGGDRAFARAQARRALKEAIREFNGVAWRFNRRTKDITFVADTSTYTLDPLTRNVWKVMLLDASNKLTTQVEWKRYEDFLRYDGSTQSGVTIPDEYTIMNVFYDGLITFLPAIGPGPFTNYPKARVFWHQRIALPQTDDDNLLVPPEVETAIVQRAQAILISRTRTLAEAAAANTYAEARRFFAEREWMDFPDFEQRMR